MNAPQKAYLQNRPASPYQRQYARILMRELDLPTDVITLLHRRFYNAAKVPFPQSGTRLDDALGTLTFAHAGQLIGVLVKEHKDTLGDES